MEKSKNLCVRPMDMNWGMGGNAGGRGGAEQWGILGEKNGTTVIA